MVHSIRKLRWFLVLFFFIPFLSHSALPVKTMVIFGDSLSDTGNTTHLLKSLRQDDDPAFLVAPFKVFVLNKMVEYAEEYYVPQMVLDSGIAIVVDFFDNQLAPYLANFISKIKLVPVLPGKPYWNSRFSNGRVWNEYLAQMLSISTDDEEVYLNKAFGGSWAATYDYQLSVWNLIRHPLGTIKNLIVGKLVPPSLSLTVQAYLLEHPKLSNETVFFIFAGSNDYINILSYEDNYNIEIMSTYIDNVLSSTGSAVMKLMKAGARRFVIMGVPPLGNAPRLVQTSDSEVLNNAVTIHNQRLQTRMQEWEKIYPDANFLYVDINDYLQRALKTPDNYGFTNTNDACIDVKLPMYNAFASSPFANNYVLRYAQVLQYRDKSFAAGDKNYTVCDNPDSYLFWDEIHPSTRAHGLLAFEICKTMKNHGYAVACPNPL